MLSIFSRLTTHQKRVVYLFQPLVVKCAGSKKKNNKNYFSYLSAFQITEKTIFI